MKSRRRLAIVGVSLAMGALPLVALGSSPVGATAPSGTIHFMRTVDHASHGGGGGHHGSRSSNLLYWGGTSDPGAGIVGVETAPKVYLVFWGSQWSSDPSGEAAILTNFFNHVGGTSWNNTVTQYCQGATPAGSYTCSGGTPAGNPSNVLQGTWLDNGSLAPSSPTQSQLAAEAVIAAAHFGNTTAVSNGSVQYVVATSTGNSMNGFGTQWCAWHSSTSSTYGDVAYTNLPYITDAGARCGANFVNSAGQNLGPKAGITIVAGHEFAETETDQFPNGGWLNGSGSEIGDLCAWDGGTTNVSLNSVSFPVQPLWSNAANGGNGGCVQSY
jgi:hypothetical protein